VTFNVTIVCMKEKVVVGLMFVLYL